VIQSNLSKNLDAGILLLLIILIGTLSCFKFLDLNDKPLAKCRFSHFSQDVQPRDATFRSGPCRSRDILVWPFQCGDISVTTFLYVNNWLPLFIGMIT